MVTTSNDYSPNFKAKVDELMAVTRTQNQEDRIKSIELFLEIMNDVNAETSHANQTFSR